MTHTQTVRLVLSEKRSLLITLSNTTEKNQGQTIDSKEINFGIGSEIFTHDNPLKLKIIHPNHLKKSFKMIMGCLLYHEETLFVTK